jgi:hypothetical protein
MLTTIEGVYHDGKIELLEVPQNIQEDMLVLVTFMASKSTGTPLDLPSRGIDRAHAADLRARLAAFAEDWESPEMQVYDNYGAAKSTV